MKNMISSKLLCTDVLAVRCIDEFLFVGIGYVLHIFNRRTCKLVRRINALFPYNIHGIVREPNNKVLVYGGNAVRVYDTIRTDSGKIELDQLYSTDRLSDWVIAAKWLPVDDFFNLIVLYAHNIVQMYDVFSERQARVYCNARCILYGGSLSIKETKDIVVFSGTVFQEILIWEIRRELPVRENAPVLHRLRGHNGVIFSIVYDPSTRLICSTSDDRTVRLWDVTAAAATATARDGRDTQRSEVDWKTAKIKLIRTMYGHTGRVWRSVIREKTVISIGEDSLICTWLFTGKLLNKIYGHHGAAVWSMDVSEEDEILLTGGADGEIRALPLETEEQQVRATISLPIDDGTRASPKYISYLNSGILMIYCDDGRVSCYGGAGDVDRRAERSFYLPKYGSYSVIRTSPCRRYVAFASNDGYVEVYKERRNSTAILERVSEEKAMEPRILSLHWLGNDGLVACGPGGILKVYRFTMREGMRLRSVRLLPQSRERWLTAAALCKQDELFVCADRAGSVHVYNLLKGQTDPGPVESIERPVQTLTKVHGRIGVQVFMIFDDESRLMSAGRDGTLKFYELRTRESGGGRAAPLRMLHTEKMPMDWIGDIIKTADDILILGFKETEFIIYEMSGRRVLTRIACGGGHRSWDCARFAAETVVFAFIRSKQVFTCECEPLRSLKCPAVVSNGFHAKETYCVEALAQVNGRTVFLSAGEDTSIRVTCVSRACPEGTYNFRTIGIFDGHVSSVKCMTSIKLHENAAGLSQDGRLVFSAGGRAQIKVWEMLINEEKIGESDMASKHVSCTDVTGHLLHGTDRHRRKPWQDTATANCYEMQPETRYMDIDVFRPNGSMYRALIFVGCADGRLRTFVYNGRGERSLRLKATIRYVDRCILKISVLPGTTTADRVIVLTMSTDGIVRFYDLTEIVTETLKEGTNEISVERKEETTGTIVAEFRFHQSGINAFDLKELEKGEYILATGGDDNLFNLAIFRVDVAVGGHSSVMLSSSWKIASAHTAQITGIRFNDGQNKVYSVGVDQRVVMYEYECLKSKIVSAKIADQTYTAVPDVQGIVLLPPVERVDSTLACVYGKGFELFTFE